MPLIYAAVARGSVLLAEYSVFAGNFSSVAKDYLSKAANAGRHAYSVDAHVFSFLGDDGYTYVVVTDEATGRTIPNAFLDRVKEEFVGKFADKGRSVPALGLSSFAKRLRELMEHATQFPEQYSKVALVQKKVDEVKSIMSDNIEKVLSRGEKLDLLVDKTDNLMFEADRFVKSGRALRRKMWLNNLKTKLVFGLAVVMVVVIVLLLICFGSGHSCVKKKAGAPSLNNAAASPSPSPAAASLAPAADPPGRRLLMTVLGGGMLPAAAGW